MHNIQRIAIFYFSGTGNSKRIALWLLKFASEENVDCRIFNIAQMDLSALERFDSETLIGFISPIHGFNYPKITLNFIRNFPKGRNRILLMNTRAGMKIGRYITPGLTGIAFMLSSILLHKKGYKVIGQVPFDMPSNWISIHPALRADTLKFIGEKNQNRVKIHLDKVLSGQTDFLAYRDLIQDVLISPIALAYYIAGRFFFAKSFYASSACDSCGVCEKICPVKAIKSSNDRPFWTFKCESCMKCMNTCPQQAIQTTHGLWVVLIVVSLFAMSLSTKFLFGAFQSQVVKFTLFTLVLILLLWVFYGIQHLLLRNKLVARMITYTSLTYYRFWGRYRCKSK